MSSIEKLEVLSDHNETERKYEVDQSLHAVLEGCTSSDIDQGYFRTRGDTEYRVRRSVEFQSDDSSDTATAQTSYYFTRKIGSGVERPEKEVKIDQQTFELLWPLTIGRRITKVRYKVPLYDDLVAEVDFYGGALAGLVVAEVEFKDKEASKQFIAPDWFGREVTEDKSFKNKELAIKEAELRGVNTEIPLATALDSLKKYIEILVEISNKPVVVAVAGGSATGKTTAVADKLGEHFGDDALTLSLDMYYKGREFMDEQHRLGHEVNFDHPDSVDLELAANHLKLLSEGQSIEQPLYSFAESDRIGHEHKDPTGKKLIVLEGLFALDSDIANNSDLTIYVDTTVHGRLTRRVLRDVTRANWAPTQILEYFQEVQESHQLYVEPTSARADVIVSNNYDPAVEAINTGAFEYQIKYPITEDNDVDEESLRKVGAELLVSGVEQVDVFFNTEDSNLGSSDELVGIRTTGNSLTYIYKGPRSDISDIRQRPKIEYPLTPLSLEAFRSIYTRPVKTIIKTRSLFVYEGVVVTLDNVSSVNNATNEKVNLGKFVEIRSNDDNHDLRQIAQELGFNQPPELRSYFDM